MGLAKTKFSEIDLLSINSSLYKNINTFVSSAILLSLRRY
jgi:hypothetical protein